MLFERKSCFDSLVPEILDTLLHQGKHRCRQLTRSFKERVSRTASEGKGEKSGAHMLQLMQRFKIFDKQIRAVKAAND